MAEKDTRRKSFKPREEQSEFAQHIVDIARVTRVMAGGKRMRFRICLVIGDRKGRVGMGVAKGKDVSIATEKAFKKAEKNIIKVALVNGTIAHEVLIKNGASKILLKPAPQGTGVIAGGACRIVFDLAGIKNIVSKVLGGNNKINNVKATIEALTLLKKRPVKEVKKETVKVEVEKEVVAEVK